MNYKTDAKYLPVIIIGLSVLYQCLCAIQGFDLTDEGHLMSAYQLFGSDPLAAKCGSGYPLTCYIGWLLNSIYPAGGILMMRMWGIFMVSLTEIISYKYLSRYFSTKVVLIGLLIQAVFLAGDPKPFGYNNMTIFFGVISLVCINEGVRKVKWGLIVLGGLLAGMNVFVRLPNVTFVSFALIPFLWNYDFAGIHWKKSTAQAMVILMSFASGMVAVWLLLVHIGADTLVTEFVSSIANTLQGKSTHSTDSLLMSYLSNYRMCIVYLGILILGAVVFCSAFQTRWILLRCALLFLGFEILYRPIYMDSSMLGDTIMATINGISIAGACYYMAACPERRNVALTAVLLSSIGPLGSDGGFRTMWASTWLALPVGLSGLYEFCRMLSKKRFSISFTLKNEEESTGKESSVKNISFPICQLNKSFWCCTVILLAIVFIKIDHKAYYDPGDRTEKIYPIESRLARGIYTMEKKAGIINPLLRELDRYVKPGDTMLVYDFSPLLYYLTETRPFAGISWPCVFFGERYVKAFVQAEKESERLPVIVLQHFFSSNEWTSIQRNYYDESIDTNYISSAQTKTIKRFIKKYKYKRVWSNGYYEILVPSDYKHNIKTDIE